MPRATAHESVLRADSSHLPLSSALAPVGEKLFESFIRERVLDELLNHFERHCGNICADARRFEDVNGAATARSEHFRFPVVVAVDFNDFSHQLQQMSHPLFFGAEVV